MGVGAGLYMYDVVVKKFTFAISSPDELLYDSARDQLEPDIRAAVIFRMSGINSDWARTRQTSKIQLATSPICSSGVGALAFSAPKSCVECVSGLSCENLFL